MGFRENLQHLRAQHHMTQEQLAMLLGVSRQSVTKWEAERAYPEMDKLLKLCEVFDVALDDLVRGDVTGKEPSPRALMEEGAPATDACGYDRAARLFAQRISVGVGLLGCAVPFIAALDDPSFTRWTYGIALAVALVTLLGMAGLWLLVRGGMARSDFKRAHPFVQDFYTKEERQAIRSRGASVLAAGICVAALSVIVQGMVLPDGVGGDTPWLLIPASLGVAAIVHGSLTRARPEVERYNLSNASERPDAFKGAAEEAGADASSIMREAEVDRQQAIVMLGATAVGLSLLGIGIAFAPGLLAAFWIPWPIGGLICAVIEVRKVW